MFLVPSQFKVTLLSSSCRRKERDSSRKRHPEKTPSKKKSLSRAKCDNKEGGGGAFIFSARLGGPLYYQLSSNSAFLPQFLGNGRTKRENNPPLATQVKTRKCSKANRLSSGLSRDFVRIQLAFCEKTSTTPRAFLKPKKTGPPR